MPKDIHVLVIEDDPYARDLISLLLTRDWRIRVVGEFASQHALNDFLSQPAPCVEVVLLDTEIPGNPELPFELTKILMSQPAPPAILYMATKPDEYIFGRLAQLGFGGYVIKNEIQYALGSAVTAVAAGKRVITRGLRPLAARHPLGAVQVFWGSDLSQRFTPRELDLIRLALIFNLSIRDMADELVLSSEWVSELVSGVYKKLGLREILAGEVSLEEYIDDPTILARCREITRRPKNTLPDGRLRKAPWMSTLAFHLLTAPEIDEL